MPIMDWRELRDAVQEKQTGESLDPEISTGIPPQHTREDALAYFDNLTKKPSVAERYASMDEGLEEVEAQAGDWTELADALGYGDFRGDLKVPFDQWVQNPIDMRSRMQTGIGQLANGLAKMVAYTPATFLDNTVGLAAALLPYTPVGTVAEAIRTGDASALYGSHLTGHEFVDTPWAQWMQKFRDWSERTFPNYRTVDEMADQDHWWKHLNYNFWGDVFLKNVGFTLGSMGSGMLLGKGFSQLRGKELQRAYRAAVAAADGNPGAAKLLDELFGPGPKVTGNLHADLEKALVQYNKVNMQSQLIGSMAGAIGEGRTEALMAAKEFRDEQLGKAQADYDYAAKTIERNLLQDERFVSAQPIYDGYGNVVDYKPALNEAGQEELARQMSEAQRKYQAAVDTIEREAESLADTTFSLNIPILTASNWIMFGRMFSGGFKSQASAKLRGRPGKYRPTAYKGKVLADIGKVGLSEGMEELSQKMISEGAKDIGRHNMEAFYDGVYDKEAIHNVFDNSLSMLRSSANVFMDPKSWEEFAVGWLTGTIMGAFRAKADTAQNIADRKRQQELAEALNDRYNDPEFRPFIAGLVRHEHYDGIKDTSLAENNQFAWHTADDAQLIGDVSMFARAGRLKDLKAMVDGVADLQLSDMPEVRALLADDTDPEFNKKSDEQLLKWIKDRADKINDTIEQYRTFRDSIDFLSFGSLDEDAIDELVYTKSQLQNFEKRYKDLLAETMRDIRPAIELVAKQKNKDGSLTDKAQKAVDLLDSVSLLDSLFGFDFSETESPDEHPTVEVDKATESKAVSVLEDIGVFASRPELKKSVEDLKSLIDSRQQYYARLFGKLQDGKKVEDEIDKAEEEAIDDLSKDAAEHTVSDAVEKLKKAKSLKEYAEIYDGLGLESEVDDLVHDEVMKDPRLKTYEDKIASLNKFFDTVADQVDSLLDSAESDEERLAIADIQDRLDEVGNDLNPLLAELDNEDSVELVFGKALLDALASSPAAQAIAYSVLKEKIEDAKQISRLGFVSPDSGGKTGGGKSAPGEGGSGSSGGDSGTVSERDVILDKLNGISDPHNDFLNKIANGDFSGYDALSDQDMIELAKKAQEILRRNRAAAGLDSGESDDKVDDPEKPEQVDDNNPVRIQARKDKVQMETSSLRGNTEQFYNPDKLILGIRERLKALKAGLKAKLSWLAGHNVQDFVDVGALADLDTYYRKKGTRLPIYFIANPHIENGNLDENPFTVEYVDKDTGETKPAIDLLLAVELNEENRRILAKYQKAGFFAPDSLITIGEDESAVQYQVIGHLWNPSESQIKDIEKKNPGSRKAYEAMKKQYNTVWEYAVRSSIQPQYDKDVKAGVPISKQGKWYVAEMPNSGDTHERLYTTLNYIMSGRNMAPHEFGYEKRSLSSALKEYSSFGKKYYFAIAAGDSMKTTTGAPSFPVNDIKAPQGSIWIATQVANGAWSWSHISVARTDEVDFDAHADSTIIKKINKAVDTIFGETELSDKLAACSTLSKLIYLGTGNTASIFFNEDGSVQLVIGGSAVEQGFNSKNEFFSTLKKGGYRFQVSLEDVNDPKVMGDLIDAGILRTEMESFVRRGATFGVNFLSDKDAEGKPVAQPYPLETGDDIARTAGSEAVVTGNVSGKIKEVTINMTNYQLMQDGSVRLAASKSSVGREIDDPTTVASVKALAEVIGLEDDDVYPGLMWKKEVRFPAHKSKSKQKESSGPEDTVPLYYVELYERIVDGIKVHMIRRGKNGAVKLIYSDGEWENLRKVMGDPVGSTYKEIKEDPRVQQEEDQKRFDEMRSNDPVQMSEDEEWSLGDDVDMSPTVQEKDKESDRNEDEFDCFDF